MNSLTDTFKLISSECACLSLLANVAITVSMKGEGEYCHRRRVCHSGMMCAVIQSGGGHVCAVIQRGGGHVCAVIQ